jgi:hypothetical protein
MGLAPIGTKVDDEIWLLSSAKAFSILRPVEGGRYHYVGECYLHGLMNGKVMEDLAEKTVEMKRVWLNGFHRKESSKDFTVSTVAETSSSKLPQPASSGQDKGFTFGTDATIKTFYEKPG